MAFIQGRVNVDATPKRCIDVDTTLTCQVLQRAHDVPAGELGKPMFPFTKMNSYCFPNVDEWTL